METCTTCGAERRRIGVLYPARLLCACERRTCACGKLAVIVEFQAPVKGLEPPLPATTNGVAHYFCTKDSPADFPLEEPVKARSKPKKNEVPHIDPIWTSPTLPPGANSPARVKCVVCKTEHAMKQRRMFNGTESQCPKCGELVCVFADEEEAA